MQRTLVINVVGLTRNLIGEHTPNLQKLLGNSVDIKPMVPAVTCAVQATYLTGKTPAEHGIVANGWYFRDLNEVWLWRQSNRLIQAPKIWDIARAKDSSFTCANTFWWYAMATGADYTLTPRPLYCADGSKLPDCYTYPLEWREELSQELGPFPLFQFWGPATSIKSSAWIADAAISVELKKSPSLQLVYLPHLDYCLQKVGPQGDISKDLQEVDGLVGKLLDFFTARNCRVIVLSEYGIGAVDTPVHPNRILRQANLLAVKTDLGREYLETATSKAFAVADHQIAHVYIQDAELIPTVKALFEQQPGIARVLDAEGKRELGLDHERSGELVLLAEANAWFTYYYWLDDNKAPDFAPTVEIHRKPGYDPCELFFNPTLRFPMLRMAGKVLRKKLGFRYLMDVISIQPEQVKGSHGLALPGADSTPIFMSTEAHLVPSEPIAATDVCDLLLRHVFDE
ncbi:alkaline phosphatase family protein [Cellvibrio sp. PSBB023]|uniref:alkaline phosphatase family protein n=1 Tax=Cellvibrio sp. PSBB023 TaxID=1945512 RepID=UPI00098E9EB9|nr:nucleotide pyrophosphatase/phosphodiesterase family protein [Cellvibrio sp. PSBB023]AQT62079.1 alkaline phosphatase family protein [Cellvibrio sp. PSBB023]